MENIKHEYVTVRGLKLHVAETGTGPAVVFLHGFPEIWYSWRYQMVALAAAGFRAIAPDHRGYGLSEQPAEPEKTTYRDLVDDLLELLDKLSIDKAFLIGKDFGGRPAYHFAILHPERVSAIITIGVPFLLSGEENFPRALLPKGFYILRFMEPGRAEKDFARFDVKTVVKNVYILMAGSELPSAEEGQEIMDLVDPATPLPPWLSEEDLSQYAALYEKSGFRTALQVPYRAWVEDYGLPMSELLVKPPTLLIMGAKDYACRFPGIADYVSSGMVKNFVPDLEVTFLPEGTHFVQEQSPDEVNKLIITFLNKHI